MDLIIIGFCGFVDYDYDYDYDWVTSHPAFKTTPPPGMVGGDIGDGQRVRARVRDTSLKYKGISNLLKRRIEAGDYAITPFPGEMQLAAEMGVSRKTIRRALQALIDEGLLKRAPNRRLVVSRPDARKMIGFLAPGFASMGFDAWRIAVENAARERNLMMRTVDYFHDDDAVINDALEGLDGVFVILGSDSSREIWTERLGKSDAIRGAVIDYDLSADGIVSLVLHPPRWVEILLDYLFGLGHRHIDCFNVQPPDSVIHERIAVWRSWCKRKGVTGELVGNPVRVSESVFPRAVEDMERWIAERDPAGTALFCTTEAGAMGAARALVNRRFTIGRDVSLCCSNEEAMARYSIPTLTTLATADRRPFIEICLDWMQQGRPWSGPKLLEPKSASLLIGESTG
jgi:DNA-binding LacI/PurR family transcriptional regulator